MKLRLLLNGLLCLVIVTIVCFAVRSALAELTEKQAIDRARRFIRNAGLPEPNLIPPGWTTPAPLRAKLSDSVFGFRVWDIQFHGDYAFKLDAQTGELLHFDHSSRTYELVHRLNRTGIRKLKTVSEARERCFSVARAFGLPSRAVLSSLTLRDSHGMTFASFTEKPFGYPQLAPGNGMSVVIDPQDAMPKQIYSSWRMRFAAPKPRITAQSALELAKRQYAGIHQRGSGFHRGTYSSKKPPKLGYVTPNTNHQVARLAWVVPFGSESVWIDAETARPLGSTIFK